MNPLHGVVCSDCRYPIAPELDHYGRVTNWVHVDEVRDHDAEPAQRCYSCGSFDVTWREEAYGNAKDCRSCGRHDFQQIGD